MAKEKFLPEVGDKLYLSQETGRFYVDITKTPYTVIEVSKTEVKIQSCRLVFPVFHYDPKTMSPYYKQFDGQRPRFFDTVAESIEPDPNGRIKILHWAPKTGRWQCTEGCSAYPEFAHFGEYQHQPYLD